MVPEKRHIYNSSSEEWRVSCVSRDVHLANGWHAEEDGGVWTLAPGGGVCVYFAALSNSRKWRPEPGLIPCGINPRSAWIYGSANIAVETSWRTREFKMLLAGKSTSRWTPIYLSEHRFANRNLGGECLGDLNLRD